MMLGGVGGPDTDDDFDDAGGGIQNWPKVDDVICAGSLSRAKHKATLLCKTMKDMTCMVCPKYNKIWY